MLRKKILLPVLVAAILATAALVTSRASSGPSAPPGVAPEMWNPISDRLGIAIRGQSFGGRTELYGTFMVREGGQWRAVNIAPGQPGIVPAR
jgi:hypothetical protein